MFKTALVTLPRTTIFLAEGEGLEPSVDFRPSLVFKTSPVPIVAPLQDYAGEKSHLTPFLYLGLFTLHYGVNILPRRARRTLCKVATHFAVYLIS